MLRSFVEIPPIRGMGSLIRLCLHQKIDLWFIPMREPWHNGVVEKFNDHYQQKFLNKTNRTENTLFKGSLKWESQQNSRYRLARSMEEHRCKD
jgi:hypothetical protein